MHSSLFFRTDASILCLLLFFACLLMVWVGHRLRLRFLHPEEPESKGGVNSLLGALFGLWGFLLAFTFGNSSARFEAVRNVMIDETNAIRGAIFRSKAFPDSLGDVFRADLGRYLEARKAYYHSMSDPEQYAKAKNDIELIGVSLWDKAISTTTMPNMGFSASNMLASLSLMFDAAVKRDALLVAGLPEPIHYLLFFLAITISFIGGFTTPVIKHKEWIIITGFILLACCIIYLTLDLGRPMRGFIRPEANELRLEGLQRFLKE